MKLEHLRTLAAIVDAGTFDAAATRMHLTPSAVSQRVKAIEAEVGAVLLTRTTPCEPTSAGEVLVRLGRQVALLEDEARTHLRGGEGRVDLPVAVTQDVLATWFLPVLEQAATWEDVQLRLIPEDQSRTSGWLRSGAVLAAVTAESEPVVGCRVQALGSLTYRACAHPSLLDRWGTGARSLDLAHAPVVRYNAADRLQHDLLDQHAPGATPPETWVPSTEGVNDAIGLGLGWGLVPEPMLARTIARHPGLVELDLPLVRTPLHWQRWKVESPALDRLTDAVLAAAPVD